MQPIRVLLVSIHVERGPEAVPLGAACAASALKADPELGGRLEVGLLEAFAGDRARDLAARIAGEEPDLVGFSVYLWNRELSVAAARAARGLLPASVFFAGGADATASPSGLLTDSGGPFDFVVAGEAETSLPAAVRALVDGGDPASAPGVASSSAAFEAGARFFRAPPADPAALPSPWLDGTLRPSSEQGALWELARGCPYACAYCYESKGERRVRYLDERRIDAELALFARAKVPSVFVLDPTFNADKGRAKRLLDKIAAAAPGAHWHFEVRAESLDRELAERFARMGASLQIGLQTARPEVAALVDRKLDRGLFASRVGLLNDAGATFGLDLIYGLPGDDLAGFRSSLDFALGLYPNNLDLFRLAVLPGTALAERAASLGLEADPAAPYLVRSTPTFSERDLDAAARLSRAADVFYNKGRAVPWFNQVLHAAGRKPAAFLEGFAAYLDRVAAKGPAWDPRDPVGVERLQLGYLDSVLEGGKVEYVLPAVWDVVRFHGAWARAVAEGIETAIDCSYDPESLVGEGAVDLEEFASVAEPCACRVRVRLGAEGPEVSVS